ncbi:MAG: hypothetical protein IK045_06740 [Bacteroidales bacterium]|nr:hypothetical protein [Bacteroidales bacterium]
MKKLMFLLVAAMPLVLAAQNVPVVASGSLNDVSQVNRLSVRFAWDGATIAGMSEKAYALTDKAWEEGKAEAERRFIVELNSSLRRAAIEAAPFDDTKYTLLFSVLEVTKTGDVSGIASILDKRGREVAVIENILGRGGKVGSFSSITADGFENAAKKLGRCFLQAFGIIYSPTEEETESIKQLQTEIDSLEKGIRDATGALYQSAKRATLQQYKRFLESLPFSGK